MVSVPNALIVGATGFLGRTLANRLHRDGVATYSLVFQDRPRRPLAAGEAVESRSSAAADIRAALAGVRFDCVYHVAAAGVSPSERDPQTLLDGNIGLISNVLLALENAPPRRVLFAGSCAEYSRAVPPQLISEEHPTAPHNIYGAAKAAATIWATALAERLGIPLVTLRLFHIYGPGEAPSRLAPHLVDCLRNGVRAKLTMGEQVRDLLYIDDVVSALVAAGAAASLPETIYNVCSGKAVSVRGLASAAASVLGKSTEFLEFGALPYRPDEEMWIVGDNRRFLRDTNWSPAFSLEEGMTHFVRGRLGPSAE
jgi:UDP-glucose 4-epimerase